MGNTVDIEDEILKVNCCMYTAADQLAWFDPNNNLTDGNANNLYQFLYEFCLKTNGNIDITYAN